MVNRTICQDGTLGGCRGQTSHPLTDSERRFWRQKAQEYRQEAYAIEQMLEYDEEQQERKDID